MKNRNYFRAIDKLFSTRIFNYKDILLIGSGFVAVVILLNKSVRFIRDNIMEFNCPLYWPISIFKPRIPDLENLFVAIVVMLFFGFSVIYISKSRLKIWHVIFIGIILVIGSNLIQGWKNGIITPIVGVRENDMQYYQDAIKVEDPSRFLRHFEQLQPDLLMHPMIHPPGAVLTIYFLKRLLGRPAFISFAITILSVFLSMLFLYGLFINTFRDESISVYLTFLFILIPGIQIYYAATVDALIASFFLGVLYFFMHRKYPLNIFGSIIFLFLVSFLTFIFVFILPVMAGFEFLRRRSVLITALSILGLAVIHIIIYIIFNFNYINSFLFASAFLNPHGFRLIAEPASYVSTGFEGIFEIMLFFGPFLAVLMIRGIPVMKKNNPDISTITLLAVSTLLAMFAAACFHTGETTRICLFIYPYLIFPAAFYLESISISTKEKAILLFLVFTQTLLMQLFGGYLW